MIGEMNRKFRKRSSTPAGAVYPPLRRFPTDLHRIIQSRLRSLSECHEPLPRRSAEPNSTAMTLCMAGIDRTTRFVHVSDRFDIEFLKNSSSRDIFPSLFDCRDINLESVDENAFPSLTKEMQP